jgi:cytochrome c peroxidase
MVKEESEGTQVRPGAVLSESRDMLRQSESGVEIQDSNRQLARSGRSLYFAKRLAAGRTRGKSKCCRGGRLSEEYSDKVDSHIGRGEGDVEHSLRQLNMLCSGENLPT